MVEKHYKNFDAIGNRDRKEYIMDMFRLCFPGAPKRLEYDTLVDLSNMTIEFADFLQEVNDYYSLMKGLPDWTDSTMLNHEELREVKQYIGDVGLKTRIIEGEVQKIRMEAGEKIRQKLKEIDEVKEKYKDNKLCYIFTIGRKDLPIDVNMNISDYKEHDRPIVYKGKDGEDKTHSRSSLSQMFINEYRRKLLEIHRNGGDVKKFVDDNRAKSIQGQEYGRDNFFSIGDNMFYGTVTRFNGHNLSMQDE